MSALPSEDSFIGAALTRISNGGLHLGLAYRSRGEPPRLLHLAWHWDLRDEKLKNKYLVVLLPLDEIRALLLAQYCRLVAANNGEGRIPYAFNLPKDCFDAATGAWLLSDSGHGVTCATFVLAVLQAQGVKVLKLEEWPEGRDEDVAFQALVAEVLTSTGAPADHVAYVKAQLGGARIQPAEVAGGSGATSLPSSFEEAVMGASVLKEILENG